MVTKIFSQEEYYNDGHWKKVVSEKASYYEILGFALTDQISIEKISLAHEERWKWWKDVEEKRNSGKGTLIPKVEDAGPKVKEALVRLEQAKVTLQDSAKRKAYDQTLCEEKTKPLLDYLERALKDKILSE